MSFFAELKHRNVLKVEVAYIVFALLIIWANETLTLEPVAFLASQTS